ncbi:MAG: hypothetical protein M1836_001144 [Candelina mexicana]|nr:MAG: hypothetical protein M1836_001144 [Candelina mexicana]
MYPSMLEKQLLNRIDTLALARLLHTHYRINLGMGSEESNALLQHFQRIISDLKHGRLQPHPAAHVHIISYFKESKQFDLGEEYWRWLVQQDEIQLDARAYGSVIELLAYRGESLTVLEEMYTEALNRFPGQFSEYHLSPGAIIANPKQATVMAGTRMFLLQGILTARVLHGDWRNAYLALDTALRLYPTQVPSRFFELLIYERPTSEAYQVFLIACRCGTPPSSKVFVHMLESLEKSMTSEGNSTVIHINTYGMFNVLRAYMGSGGTLNHYHFNILANQILSLLPPNPAASGEGPSIPDDDRIQQLANTFQFLLNVASQVGIHPTISTFNKMITMGGKRRRLDLVDLAWKEIHQLGLQPNDITYRVMLLAGGYLEDVSRVRGAWHDLKHEKRLRGGPERLDWKTYAKAAKKVGLDFIVEAELPSGSDIVSEQIRKEVRKELNEGTHPEHLLRPSTGVILARNPLYQLLLCIDETLSGTLELLESKKRLDFFHNPLLMALSDTSPPRYEHFRDLYNKLSRDPALVENPPNETDLSSGQPPAATTTTGFPLDELRFQNWSAINALLIEAERTEKLKLLAVDRAIETGKPVKRMKQGIRVDSALQADGTSELSRESKEEIILKLRGHVR